MEKLGAGAVKAREGPGVGLQRVLTAVYCPVVPAAATAAGVWDPGPRRRLLCCCAASSREPHIPAQRCAPGPRCRSLPRDTPPPPPARARGARPLYRPRAWPPGMPRPLANWVVLGRGCAGGTPRDTLSKSSQPLTLDLRSKRKKKRQTLLSF